MHAIESELITATGYKAQRKFSNRQDYLGSILNAVIKLSNDDFDNLTDDAANWANAAIEAKNAKSEILPDFDELGEGDENGDDTSDNVEGDVSSDSGDDLLQDEIIESPDGILYEEPELVEPPKKKAKVPAKKGPPKSEGVTPIDEEVILDKWGCMEGSKNSQALAMFEKGATTKEVKAEIGGTYYNILGKLVLKGHRLEKEGSLIRLVHRDEMAKRAGAKPVSKKK